MNDDGPTLMPEPDPEMRAERVALRDTKRQQRQTLDAQIEALDAQLGGNLAPSIGELSGAAVEQMRRRARGDEKPIPLPWPSVAKKMNGGLWPGLTVLVGSTGSGKSQWALQVALEAARKRVSVLYVGLELGPTGLVARLLGLMTGRKWSRLFLGKDAAELDKVLAEHGDELQRLPLHVEEAPPYGWKPDRLRTAVAALCAEHGPDEYPPLVVLDFLQLVSGDKGQPLRERIQQAAYEARAVARDYNAAVLVVSSTARDNYGTLGGTTKDERKKGSTAAFPWDGPAAALVGLGKESGEVEYAADAVLTLVSAPWGSHTPPPEGTHVHLAVAKQRAGTSGWCELRFDGGRFTEPKARSVRV